MRKSLSKRTRFEIFKRDKFRCLYCGASPAESLLRVDHVDPVSKGGSDEPHNLVTSCQDCNGGKSNVPLDQRKLAPTMSVNDAREHAEQLKAYLAIQREIFGAKKDLLSLVDDHWTDAVGWTATDRERASLRTFVERLGIDEVVAAIDIAAGKVPAHSAYSAGKTFAYFCGICWRRIKSKEQAPPPLPQTLSPQPAEVDHSEWGDSPEDDKWSRLECWPYQCTLQDATVDAFVRLLERSPVRINIDTDDPCVHIGTSHPSKRDLKGVVCIDVSLSDTPNRRRVFVTALGINVPLGRHLLFAPWRALRQIEETTESGETERTWELWPRNPTADLLNVPNIIYSTTEAVTK